MLESLPEYMEVIMSALTDFNPTCADSIKQGFKQIVDMAQSASGRQSLSTTFRSVSLGSHHFCSLCSPITSPNSSDILELYAVLAADYMSAVQYAGLWLRFYGKHDLIDIAFDLYQDICQFHMQSFFPVITRMKNVSLLLFSWCV